MKKLRITIDGRVYEATVEVLEDDEQTVPGAAALTPSPLPSRSAALRSAGAPAASPPAAPPAASPPASARPGPAGERPPQAGDPGTVAAPIAGTVQKVFVKQGTHVEAKTPLIMLDAMKMDTYIYAPRTGEIAEVMVKEGDPVQVGTVLLRYRAEG